ncbi:hypothetical protein QQ045_020595 [Rhodiola kirilowii]
MAAVCFVVVLLLLRTMAAVSLSSSSSSSSSFSYSSWTGFTHLNASNFLNATGQDKLRPSPLQDVVRAISASQNWSFRDTIVTKLDSRRSMIGSSLSYEFRVRMKKTDLELKFSDEVKDWKKLRRGVGRRGKWRHLVNGIKNAEGFIGKFKLEGPFELRASGNDLLSIRLPLNNFHTGLSRILVCEGITVEVEGAQEVSLFQIYSPGLFADKAERDKYWKLLNPSCMRTPSVVISGSSTLIAYKPQNPEASIVATYVSERVIKLSPQKCHTELVQKSACPMLILRSKAALAEKLARSVLDSKKSHHGRVSSIYLSANIKASKVIRFSLELERKVRRIDDLHDKLPKWRTRPSVERAWFQVVAKYRSGKLIPFIIKKVKPFIVVDSAPLSSLMFNISFTKFASLVPPEALTLDIKW